MHYPGMNDRRHYRAAVIGAGFGGVAVGAALGQAGIDYVILERAASIGGTWRDNTYPGCRCDVPSHLYSLSFAPTPEWTRTYSAQPEILAYLRQTADRLGVRGHIRLSHEVHGARWDPAANRWLLDTARGPFSADVLISANGVLAEPAMPGLPGLADFGGQVFHSARWDPQATLAGQRVGVVGTGASAVQIVPAIAPQVASLAVFQRTPAWILPHTDRPITSWERAVYRRVPAAQRAVRTAVYWQRELLASGMAKHPRQMALVRMVAARHLARQVPDPDLRKRLTPQYTPGCKRLVPSNDFYPALLQPQVELVTDPIERLTGRGVVTGPAARPHDPRARRPDPGHRLPGHRQPGDGPHPGRGRHPAGGRVGPGRAEGLPRDHGRRVPQPLPDQWPEQCHRAHFTPGHDRGPDTVHRGGDQGPGRASHRGS